MSEKNTKLVYSTDPKDSQRCPKCKDLTSECRCPAEVDVKTYKFVAVLRIEKAGRGGKTVTVIDQLPKQEIFLRELAADLKKKCGSGGTYFTDRKEGVIEIQGDKRAVIRPYLETKGIKSKG